MFRVGAVVIPLFAVGWAYLTRGEPGSEDMVFIIPVALLLGLAFWRLGRVEAHTDDDGIWVTNVFRRYHIPWSEVERIDSEEQGSLFGTRRATICVARKTGEKVKVSACSSTRDLSRLSTLARERGPGPGTAPSLPQTEAEGRLPEAGAPATREPPKDTEQETPTDQSDQA